MSLIYEKLGSVKFLTHSSLNSIIGEVNRNFKSLTEAVTEFLENVKYDQVSNSISVNEITITQFHVREKISVGTIDSPENVTIDANGRISAQSFLVEVAEAERIRLKNFTGDLNVAGIPGELVYIEPNSTYTEGFYGYFQVLGWVKIGGVAIGGGGSGAENLYELNDVSISGPVNGSPLIFDTTLNKWINSPYNISDFFSNLSNLNQYKIPYWNGSSFSDSNATFSPIGSSVNVDGDFSAITKSFIIDHPSKDNFKLRYGNLEGPEHGVYFRGRSNTDRIPLPYYWKDLVDIDTITVNVTPIGKRMRLYVKEITSEYITIKGNMKPDYFYTVFAERKDVLKLIPEIECQKTLK